MSFHPPEAGLSRSRAFIGTNRGLVWLVSTTVAMLTEGEIVLQPQQYRVQIAAKHIDESRSQWAWKERIYSLL